MLCSASRSILAGDTALCGLGEVVDEAYLRMAAMSLLPDAQVSNDFRLEYLRYKPGRRFIGVIQFKGADGSDVRMVATALTQAGFVKRQAKMERWGEERWKSTTYLDRQRCVAVDVLPFDPLLPAMYKYCTDEQHRAMIVRRTVKERFKCDPTSGSPVPTLAYKPARRFVTSVQSSTGRQVLLKFYHRRLFPATVTRLSILRRCCPSAPTMLGSSGRYASVALDWMEGVPLNRWLLEESDSSRCSMLEVVGCQLADLHRTPPHPAARGQAAASHESMLELVSDLAYISPSLGAQAEPIARRVVDELMANKTPHQLVHHDFYSKQVIVGSQAVRFIDFDQAGIGDGHCDLANFVAHLFWRCQLGELEETQIAWLADSLLSGYRKHALRFLQRRFELQLAAALLRCSQHPFRFGVKDWENATSKLLAKAQAAVESREIV